MSHSSHPLDAVRAAYESVQAKIQDSAIRSGRSSSSITLIAVSKKQPLERVEALYRLGHRDFGENYVQELLEKAAAMEARGCNEIRWHFIGHLQTNKVKSLLARVSSVHSIDSEKLAVEIAKRWRAVASAPTRLPVFIEVNIGREPNKSGVALENVEALTRSISGLPELELRGLMCVPEAGLDPDRLAARFANLRDLEAHLRPMTSGALSMGMSGDFPIAIAQGATHIRVGTALFGART